jgi:hypothetical protein
MTLITTTPPSPIGVIKSGQCLTLSNQGTLDYELGENAVGDFFIRIKSYSGTGTYSNDWFAIIDLKSNSTSFEPFDNAGNLLPNTVTNSNQLGFLKAILLR